MTADPARAVIEALRDYLRVESEGHRHHEMVEERVRRRGVLRAALEAYDAAEREGPADRIAALEAAVLIARRLYSKDPWRRIAANRDLRVALDDLSALASAPPPEPLPLVIGILEHRANNAEWNADHVRRLVAGSSDASALRLLGYADADQETARQCREAIKVLREER